MFNIRINIVILIILSLAIESNSAYKTSNVRKYLPGQLVVKFKKNVGKVDRNPQVQSLLSSISASQIENVFYWKKFTPNFESDPIGLTRIYIINVPITYDIPKLAALLSKDPLIEYAEPNYIAYTETNPNDSLFSIQYHLSRVQATSAWKISQGDTNVVIGILDTGVDWTHPDLAGAIWTNYNEIPSNHIDDDNNGFIDDIRGWDFVHTTDPNGDPNDDLLNQDNDPMDYQSHGTHVAGIAGAITNNRTGIASLVWKAKIMPLRIGYATSDGSGAGSEVWMAQALTYAADNGAHVANISFGPLESQLLFDAAQDAFIRGVLTCNSAGNSGDENVSPLGLAPYVLSVAALGNDDRKASFSSYHPLVDISAPGVNILSSVPISMMPIYQSYSGTSMSSPLVASLAGLIKSANPSWSPAKIMFQIIGTADSIDNLNPSFRGKLGAGRINAYRALSETPPPPLPKLSLVGYTIDDVQGNRNGKLDPGESVSLIVTIQNEWGDATNVNVKLSSNSSAIMISNDTWSPGTIKGISDLYYSKVSNNHNPFTLSAHSQSFSLVVPLTLTITADGGVNITFNFDISISPSVLFVEDIGGGGDGNDVSIKDYYTKVFRSQNVGYSYWNYKVQGSPHDTILRKYSTVIWGCEWAFPSLTSTDRSRITAYLNQGGRLFLSGQDIGWDLCEAPTGSISNEYILSGGLSKIWYENNLKARYLNDDVSGSAATTPVFGVQGDPIGDGLSFSIAMPNRATLYQYPDLIQPLAGALPIFNYGTNQVGAIRYSSNYRLVYFAFGGLEAISDTSIREIVFDRVFSWLTGRKLMFTKLNDSEDSTSAFSVTANVNTLDTIQAVLLYWNTTGEFPFNIISMDKINSNEYRAEIPSPNQSTDIYYFVVVHTSGGTIPGVMRRFHVGVDMIPPVISFVEPIPNSLKRLGPYNVIVNATDNLGVDSLEGYLVFEVEDGIEDSVRLYLTETPDRYKGSFMLSEQANSGTKIYYYVRFKDISSQKNYARLPEVGYSHFWIGRETIDDFEKPPAKWDLGNGWGRTTKQKNSGLYSMTDSPDTTYLPNSNNSLTLIEPIDLSSYGTAKMIYWRKYSISHLPNDRDTGFVEVSLDGMSWSRGKIYFGQRQWSPDTIPLPVGQGAESVRVRFRLKTSPNVQADGIYIDDIEVITDHFITGVNEQVLFSTPNEFCLYQNYPNPFNPSTTIMYTIPQRSFVSVKIYNILGQEITTLVNEIQDVGHKSLNWDASNLPSGVYFCRLDVSGMDNSSLRFTKVRKMVILK